MPKKGEYKKGATADSVRQRKYNSSPEQKKRRAERNASRRKMEKAGKARKGDGKDVDHRNHNTKDQSSGNLRMMSKGKNRAKNLGTGGRKKKGK
ncbi:putative endonuclease [Citrobacter phage CVT22]|uniref:Endonuclease n=1 Tax=Citrobacter phage CVT22 TaxID=1622234 RepID=A0A0R6CMK3_9CAUD|nr:putative endonuclease [Citrobacter phage CVT22]AJT60725.1 putative endonuclease [Citrobacter phage CVT22]